MRISELQPEALDRELLTRFLFGGIGDDGRAGDCIFVFGSPRALEYRVPKAVELYKAGRADKMLMSGGAIWEGGLTEAERMKEGAMRLGVPETAIWTERQSMNTKENVLASMLVLERAIGLHRIRRILIVSGAFHMRRCRMTMAAYMPRWIDYTCCPAEDETTRADNWWLHPNAVKRVRNEARKMIQYVRTGELPDEEV